MFLEHFVKEILPITGTSQSYEFKMYVSDRLYYEFDLEEILSEVMAALADSPDLSFHFKLELPRKGGFRGIDLPDNQISNWLTRKTHQQSGKKGEQNMEKERSLSIRINHVPVRNYAAMSKCVEKVANLIMLLLMYHN